MTDDFRRMTSFDSLLKACSRASRGQRDDGPVAAYLVERELHLLRLQRALRDGSWQPGPFHTFRVRDPKPRTISAAPFEDRIVHHALCAVVGPAMERRASPFSFACRIGMGTLAALTRVRQLVARHTHYLKLDVEHFFETVPHVGLERRLTHVITDPATLSVALRIMRHGAPGSAEAYGLPIGNLTSQHFANDYLSPLDHHVVRAMRVASYVRYMDDILLFFESREAALAARDHLSGWLTPVLGLRWKASAERFGPTQKGVPWLGFRIWPRHIRLDAARKRRLGRRLRALVATANHDGSQIDDISARMRSVIAWSENGCAVALRRSILRRLVL